MPISAYTLPRSSEGRSDSPEWMCRIMCDVSYECRIPPSRSQAARPGSLIRIPAGMFWRWAAVLVALMLCTLRAEAHVFQTSDGSIFFDNDRQEYVLRLGINLEAILAGVDPEVKDTSESPKAAEYNRLRALPPEALAREFERFKPRFLEGIRITLDDQPVQPVFSDVEFNEVGDLTKARRTTVHLTGPLSPETKTFAFGWAPDFGKVSIRTVGAHTRTMHIEVLEKGATSAPINIADVKQRTVWNMIADFIGIGFTHILPKGLDHILFVVGIFLLSTKVRPILTQVTAFTVAHTLTLGLGTLGYVDLPSSLVEPLIAASIVYVAVENILRPTLSPWRPVVVFCFGLLHGLGFAGILKEFGIPEGDFLVGLLSFNVGVELGQLTIIAICFALVGIWFGNRPWYRQRVVIPGSLVIAAVGGFWFLQRIGVLA